MTEIKLPRSWDDVTISTWKEIQNIQSDSDISKYIETLSILSDTDPEEIRSLNIREYQKVKEQTVFLSEPIKADVKLKIEIGGKKYGMIPDLNFITAGEWADAEVWKDKPIDNIHLYCAMLYRPITKEDGDYYEIEPHKSQGFMNRANLFEKELPITTVYGSVLFFSSFAVGFMQSLADYLEVDQKTKMKKTTKKTTTQKATKTKKGKRSKNNGASTI